MPGYLTSSTISGLDNYLQSFHLTPFYIRNKQKFMATQWLLRGEYLTWSRTEKSLFFSVLLELNDVYMYVAPKIFYFQNWIKFSKGFMFFFYRSMKKRRKCGNVNCAKSKVSMTIDFEPVSKKAQKWSKPSLIKHTRYILQFQKNGPDHLWKY